MHTPFQRIYLVILLLFSANAVANTDLSFIKQGLIYKDLRPRLIAQGWQPIKNRSIENTSLYAQEIHSQGLVEVVDCISMELDACTFRYSKKNQVLTIKTITRQGHVESFEVRARP